MFPVCLKPKNMKVILLFTVFFVFTNAQRFKGDACTIQSTNERGTCTLISQCPSAVEDIRRGNYPTICGFEGTLSIVCCKTSGTSGGGGGTAPRGNRKPGEIAKNKCRDFAKYVWEEQDPVIPIEGAEKIRTYECSITVISLIVGGQKAGYREFPHMAFLGYNGDDGVTYRCGGSLISENFVLTAGHCLYDSELGEPVKAAIGMINLNDRTRQIVDIVQIIDHPDYKPPSHYNDIGLVKIQGLRINSYARPACLYTAFKINHEKAIASGWGKVGYTEDQSKDLLKVTLEFFSPSKCNYTYRNDFGGRKLRQGILDETQLCAGSSKEFKDTCQGDSGGPLQIFHDDTQDKAKCMYDLVGITSFGKACGLVKNSPGVYTRVSAYIQWIEDTVWPQ